MPPDDLPPDEDSELPDESELDELDDVELLVDSLEALFEVEAEFVDPYRSEYQPPPFRMKPPPREI